MNPRWKAKLKGAASGKRRNGARAGKPRLALKERAMRREPGKSIEELAAEQGVKPTRLDDIAGKGADLWGGDLELERFVEDIYARRKESRRLAGQ